MNKVMTYDYVNKVVVVETSDQTAPAEKIPAWSFSEALIVMFDQREKWNLKGITCTVKKPYGAVDYYLRNALEELWSKSRAKYKVNRREDVG